MTLCPFEGFVFSYDNKHTQTNSAITHFFFFSHLLPCSFFAVVFFGSAHVEAINNALDFKTQISCFIISQPPSQPMSLSTKQIIFHMHSNAEIALRLNVQITAPFSQKSRQKNCKRYNARILETKFFSSIFCTSLSSHGCSKY
jgi:hypothetical protein